MGAPLMFLATSTYRLERGQGTDSYGDSVDAPTQVWEGLLGSVMEQFSNTSQPSDARGTRETVLTGRFRPGLDIREGDRLVDERTFDIFTVTNVVRPASLVNKADTQLDLMRNIPDARTFG